jgi:hypothetical protein
MASGAAVLPTRTLHAILGAIMSPHRLERSAAPPNVEAFHEGVDQGRAVSKGDLEPQLIVTRVVYRNITCVFPVFIRQKLTEHD